MSDDLTAAELRAFLLTTVSPLIEQAIEAHSVLLGLLIQVTDVIDGDTDAEDGGDDEPDQDREPSLSATASMDQRHGWTKHGGGDDAEDEFDGSEPSLGAAENHPHGHAVIGSRDSIQYYTDVEYSPRGSQLRWAGGNRDEREGDEHDGAEPDESGIGDQDGMAEQLTGEPSLGWTGDTCQTRAMRLSLLAWSVEDGEAGDDNGIGDLDGLDFDAEDSDPAGGLHDDDNGIADRDGMHEQFVGILITGGAAI